MRPRWICLHVLFFEAVVGTFHPVFTLVDIRFVYVSGVTLIVTALECI